MGTRIPTWAWIVAAGGLVAMTFIRSDSDTTGISDEEIDALARMLIVEHFGASDAERSQIIWVALNRAKSLAISPALVVAPGNRQAVRGLRAGTWNGSDVYKASFEKASSNPNFAKARAFVKEVLAGKFPNKGFKAFIHPRRMPAPPCKPSEKAPKYIAETFAGQKCMPTWAKNPTRIGIAYFYT